MQDFFISYNKADEQWAIGVGGWLKEAGYKVVFQQQDFVPSTNFAAEMHRALQNIKRMVMVLSPDYLSAKFPFAEWTAAFSSDPACEHGTLIPVRVRECRPDGLLRPIVYIDLVGLNVSDARKRFLDGIESVLKRKRSAIFSPPDGSAPKTKKAKRRKSMSQQVTGDHNTNIQAGRIEKLTIKTGSKRAPSVQPLDVVGANVEMRAYIEYLVKRYIDWRMDGIKKGIDTRPFHPSMIHRDIEKKFGARTYLTPQRRFSHLVEFLQDRIDKTIRGKNNAHRNYHSFEEHNEKLHGKKKGNPAQPSEEIPSPAEAITGVLHSAFKTAGKKAREIACVNNLKQIGVGARLWASDHGDVLPPDFASMRKELGADKILGCPANTDVRYEILSPSIKSIEQSVVYARCPFHNHVILTDGTVHRLGAQTVIQQNGKWMVGAQQ